MNKPAAHSKFLFVLRLVLAIVFVYAGVLKSKNPQVFADSIASFQILPPAFVNPLSLLLPTYEILLGILLVPWRTARPATLGVFLLTILFALALAQALARGLQVDCGCFGGGTPTPTKTWAALGRDMVLALAALWLYCRLVDRSEKSRHCFVGEPFFTQ